MDGKYTRLKLKMLLLVVLGTVIAGAVGIFLLEVVIDGVLQDPFARFFQWAAITLFGQSEESALELYDRYIRANKQEVLTVATMVLMLIAFYLAMGRFTRWLDDIRTATRRVVEDHEQPVVLPRELAPIQEDLNAIQRQLRAREEAARSAYMVLTGSLPPGCPENAYGELIRSLRGTRCILDAGGAALRLGAEAGPFLIKPNLAELEQALGAQLRTLRAIRDAALIFLRKGAAHVVVSMGAMGAMYVSQARTLYAPALKVEARSTVGAGDAMVGGMLLGLQQEGDMAHAFRCGIAAGAASVMTEGTQLIRPEDFQRLVSQVKVQEV